jgi:hypothetical protein
MFPDTRDEQNYSKTLFIEALKTSSKLRSICSLLLWEVTLQQQQPQTCTSPSPPPRALPRIPRSHTSNPNGNRPPRLHWSRRHPRLHLRQRDLRRSQLHCDRVPPIPHQPLKSFNSPRRLQLQRCTPARDDWPSSGLHHGLHGPFSLGVYGGFVRDTKYQKFSWGGSGIFAELDGEGGCEQGSVWGDIWV